MRSPICYRSQPKPVGEIENPNIRRELYTLESSPSGTHRTEAWIWIMLWPIETHPHLGGNKIKNHFVETKDLYKGELVSDRGPNRQVLWQLTHSQFYHHKLRLSLMTKSEHKILVGHSRPFNPIRSDTVLKTTESL
jgi:hypothetical protein